MVFIDQTGYWPRVLSNRTDSVIRGGPILTKQGPSTGARPADKDPFTGKTVMRVVPKGKNNPFGVWPRGWTGAQKFKAIDAYHRAFRTRGGRGSFKANLPPPGPNGSLPVTHPAFHVNNMNQMTRDLTGAEYLRPEFADRGTGYQPGIGEGQRYHSPKQVGPHVVRQMPEGMVTWRDYPRLRAEGRLLQ